MAQAIQNSTLTSAIRRGKPTSKVKGVAKAQKRPVEHSLPPALSGLAGKENPLSALARVTGAERATMPIRALVEFTTLPPGHKTFLVDDSSCRPHMREGEYAVIDLTDRALQHGEAFLIQYQGGRRPRRLVQIKKHISRNLADAPEPQETWWISDLAGWRQMGTCPDGGIPMFSGLSDGPCFPESLQEMLVGRVVGYAASGLGDVAPNALGWESEEEGNAAFDPCEYLDTLIAGGYRPYAMVIPGKPAAYYETFPTKAPTDEAWDAVMAVRWKWSAASTAHDRVIVECLRRGLVEMRAAQ